MADAFDRIAQQPATPSAGDAFDRIDPKTNFDTFMDQVKDFAKEGVQAINVPGWIKSGADALRATVVDPKTGKASWSQPGKFAEGVAEKNAESLEHAKDAWQRGDYTAAALHGFNYLMPFGSAMDDSLTDAERGKIGSSLGKALAFGVQMAAPETKIAGKSIPSAIYDAAGKLPDAVKTATIKANAKVADAVQWAQGKGIPVDAGTATQNVFVKGVQKMADHTAIGSLVEHHARAATEDALQNTAGDLADASHPTSVAPTQAGADITGNLQDNIRASNAEADQAYSELREIAADPANVRNVQTGTKQVPAKDPKTGQTIPDKFTTEPVFEDVALPVDMRGVKESLRPIRDEIKRSMPITQQRGSKGLLALDNIIDGPDAAPAVQVDRDLGSIKEAARGADMPELKTLSQGLAAKAVKDLHDAVSDAVSKAQRAPAGVAKYVQEGDQLVAYDANGDRVSQPAAGVTPEENFDSAAYERDLKFYRGHTRTLAQQALAAHPDWGVAEMNRYITEKAGEGPNRADYFGKSNEATNTPTSNVSSPQQQLDLGTDARATEQGAAPDQQGGASPRSARTTAVVPGSLTKYGATYEIRELGDLQPSHNGQTFSPNPQYPIRNDRNYNNPVNQRKVVEWSTPESFDPSYHINSNPDATNGPPLVDSEGTVLGGNGRTMIMQRVYGSNPEGAAAYRSMLEDRASQFGLDPKEVAKYNQPVLVRVIDDAELSSRAKVQDAVTDFNKSGTAALTQAEQAVADARRVSADTLQRLSDRLEELGPEATTAQAIEGRHGVDVLRNLESDGVIAPQEAAKYATEDGLTQAGKQRITQLLLGRFFRDADQLDGLPAAIRNKVERIAGPLAKLEAHGEYGLTDHVRSAIDLLETARAQNLTVEDYLHQGGLFNKQKYGPQAQAIALGLRDGNPSAIARQLNVYAEHATEARNYQGPGMFNDIPEPKTPNQAFNHAFGTSLDENAGPTAPEPQTAPQKSAGFDQSFTPTPEPPKRTAPPMGAQVGTPAGREALDALSRGRAATRAKVATQDVMNSLQNKGAEPRQVFDAALWPKDAGINRLRQIARETPQQMPKLARAFLDETFSSAAAEGGWRKSSPLFEKWENLGPQTKELLFPNPVQRADLDKFFLIAKKLAENVNPSGTAVVGSIVSTSAAGSVGYVFHSPLTGAAMLIGAGALSKAMHSPAFVRALTEGMQIPVRSTARATITANRILRIAGDAAQPVQGGNRGKVIEFPAAQTSPSPQTGLLPAAANQ